MSKIKKLFYYICKFFKFIFLVIYYMLTKHIPYYLYLVSKYFFYNLFFISWFFLSRKYYKIRHGFRKEINRKPRVTFGFSTLINHKYFFKSLEINQYVVQVLMNVKGNVIDDAEYAISFDEILDKYYNQFPKSIKKMFRNFFVFDYVLKSTDILVVDFRGFGASDIKDEAIWYKRFGIITIVFPYGSDYWMYSKIIDLCYKHGLMINYPECGVNEKEIESRVEYWSKNADCLINGGMIDGASRWDCLPCNLLCIDTQLWKPKNKTVSKNKIVIAHAPNHRYVKGTEFIIQAIDKLKNDGYNIEFLLLENLKNDLVMEMLRNKVDIFIEKLNYCIYGLSAIEAMALEIPVVSTINHPLISPLFRRFSYLNECPIVDANHENIYDVIKFLIDNEALRLELGKASRKFVEKYHSYEALSSLFDLITRKYWFNDKTVDLINCFHPLNPNRLFSDKEKIIHPLIHNNIPEILSKQGYLKI